MTKETEKHRGSFKAVSNDMTVSPEPSFLNLQKCTFEPFNPIESDDEEDEDHFAQQPREKSKSDLSR